jgi:hypothetical protein
MNQASRHPMIKSFAHRVWLSLLTGYIFLYYGEIMFWATPDREGINPSGLFLTWLLYSVFAYVFLCVAAGFRARSPWAVFLAGAVFGWFEEGIVMQTTYGSPDTPFPISISFTGLAWHALIAALVGWFVVRKVLAENRPLRMVSVAALIGAFYGFWAVFWWTEPPEPMKLLFQTGRQDLLLLRFGGFTLVTTALLIGSLWLYNRRMPRPFTPSKVEQWILGLATLAYFGLVTIPAVPKAIWVLPPLLGLTFLALDRNRRVEDRPDAIVAFNPKVGFWSYLALMVIPVVATAIYFLALAADARLRSNIVVFYATSALGAGLWIASVCVVLCRSRISG